MSTSPTATDGSLVGWLPLCRRFGRRLVDPQPPHPLFSRAVVTRAPSSTARPASSEADDGYQFVDAASATAISAAKCGSGARAIQQRRALRFPPTVRCELHSLSASPGQRLAHCHCHGRVPVSASSQLSSTHAPFCPHATSALRAGDSLARNATLASAIKHTSALPLVWSLPRLSCLVFVSAARCRSACRRAATVWPIETDVHTADKRASGGITLADHDALLSATTR